MGKNYLIAIGIDSYRKQPPLSSPVGDAEAFRDALWDRYGFHKDQTVWLHNHNATYEAIIDALEIYAHDEKQHLKADDALVIYFAGHGRYDPGSEEISILPHEGRGRLPNSTYIPYAKIKSCLGEIQAKQVLFISDACYSGGLLKGFYANFVKEELDFLGDRFELTARQAISSGGLEEVGDKGFRGHSVFCHFVLKTLKENSAEVLPASVLFRRVHNAVRHNDYPEPKFGTLFRAAGEGGEFVFRRQLTDGDEKAGLRYLNPYKGLRAFGLEDSEYFGGRDQVAALIYKRLQTRNLVGIIGASGSGKSSLALAGVCPIILQEQPDWALLKLRIGDKPIESLFYALDLWTFPNDRADQPVRFEKFQANLKHDERALYHYLKSRTQENRQTPICILDQWEELYTICRRPEDRDAFIANIAYAAQENALRVLLTVRADFYDQILLSKSGFFELLKPGLIDLRPMSEEELRQAIQKPASIADLEFAEGLVDRLISAVEGENGHLPILQFALSELWQNRNRASNTISHEVYEELGGLSGVIKKQADRVIAEELNDDERRIARLTLPSLVHVGEHGNDVKLREALSSYSSDQQGVLRMLSEERCRLVTIDRATDSTNPGKKTEYVELAHEELIRSWPTLTQWLDEDIEFHKQRSRLQSAYKQYLENKKHKDFLLPEGKPLEDAKFLREAYGDRHFSSDVMAYIETSSEKWEQRKQAALEQEKRQSEQERRLRIAAEQSTRRARFGAIVAVCLFVVAMAGAGIAWNYYLVAEDNSDLAITRMKQAESERQTALLTESRLLAAFARQELENSDVGNAIALARRALPDDPSDPNSRPIAPEATQVLYDAYTNLREERWLVGHKKRLRGALLVSDGRLLTWSDDATARLWNLDGTPGPLFEGHTDIVRGAIQIRDGRLLTWSGDATARLWDLDGTPGPILEGHNNSVWGALQIQDGRLVTWGASSKARIWNLNGTPGPTLKGLDYSVRDFMQLRSGMLLVIGQDTAELWTPEGERGPILEGLPEDFDGAIEMRDGRILLWAGYDGYAQIWNADGTKGPILRGHTREIEGGLSLRDGRLVTWGYGDQTRIWTADGREGPVLPGHRGSVDGVIELDDGKLLSWGADYILRIWNQDGSIAHVLEGHQEHIWGVSQLSDGRIVSWSLDSTVRIWNEDGTPDQILRGHEWSINGVLELPNGKLLTWSTDRTVRIWNTSDFTGRWLGNRERVSSVSQLRDGRFHINYYGSKTEIWEEGNSETTPIGEDDPHFYSLQMEDGRLLTWGADNDLQIWNLDGSKGPLLRGHEQGVQGAFEMQDGRLLSWSSDSTARIWQKDGVPGPIFDGRDAPISFVLELSDGRILTVSFDKTARIWEHDGTEGQIFEGHTKSISGILEMQDGRFFSWSYDETPRIWSKDGVLEHVLKGHRTSVFGGLQMSDGRLLTWGADSKLRVWNTDGTAGPVMVGHDGVIRDVFQMSDGRLLSWSADKTARIWNSNGTAGPVLADHEDEVIGAFQLDDNRLLTWGKDKTVRFWNSDGSPGPVLFIAEGSPEQVVQFENGELAIWGSLFFRGRPRARIWPGTLPQLLGWADDVVGRIHPLSQSELCSYYLTPNEECTR